MANQGGSHEQHVKAGQQSHKGSNSAKETPATKAAAEADAGTSNKKSSASMGKQGGSHEQHVNAGKQSHKNSH